MKKYKKLTAYLLVLLIALFTKGTVLGQSLTWELHPDSAKVITKKLLKYDLLEQRVGLLEQNVIATEQLANARLDSASKAGARLKRRARAGKYFIGGIGIIAVILK